MKKHYYSIVLLISVLLGVGIQSFFRIFLHKDFNNTIQSIQQKFNSFDDDDDDFDNWEKIIEEDKVKKNIKQIIETFISNNENNPKKILDVLDKFLNESYKHAFKSFEYGTMLSFWGKFQEIIENFNFFRDSMYELFFQKKIDSLLLYISFTDKWGKRIEKIYEYGSKRIDSEDEKKYSKFAKIKENFESELKLIQCYIKEDNNILKRNLQTEKQIKDLIRKYDINSRMYSDIIDETGFDAARVSYNSYILHKNTADVRLSLKNKINQYIKIFLKNISARLKTMETDLDSFMLKANKIDKKELINNEKFESWHKKYLEIDREVNFISDEELKPVSDSTDDISPFSAIRQKIIGIRNKFLKADEEIIKHILKNAEELSNILKKTSKKIESNNAWEYVKKNNLHYKSLKNLVKKMKIEDNDLIKKESWTMIDNKLDECYNFLSKIEFNGNSNFDVKADGSGETYIEVSQNMWDSILTNTEVSISIVSLIFSLGIAGRPSYKVVKAGQILWKTRTLRGLGTIKSFGISILKNLLMMLVFFIFLDLPLIILKKIPKTDGAGGTFKVNLWILINTLGLFGPMTVALMIRDTFKSQKKRFLNLSSDDLEKAEI